MFKFLFKLLFYLLVLAALVIGGAWLSKEILVSKYLTNMFGTTSSVQKLSISSNEIAVKGLRIQNQKGDALKDALVIDNIQITFQVADLFKKKTTIQEIIVEDSYIGVVMYNASGSDNNWTRIIEHMRPSEEAEEKPTPTKESKEIKIDHVLLTSIDVEAINTSIGDKIIRPDPIDRIEMHNVSSKDSQAFQHIISVIIRTILKEVSGLRELRDMLPIPKIEEVPKKAIEKMLSPFSSNDTETTTSKNRQTAGT